MNRRSTFRHYHCGFTDPIGPGEVLFGQRFYGGCKQCLADGGILVTQNGVPFVQGEELSNTMQIFKSLFAEAACYRAGVPAYIGGDMTFGWGSDTPGYADVELNTLSARFNAAKSSPRSTRCRPIL